VTLLHGLGHIASGRLRSQPGMVLLTPTSIAHSGTSASIGTNGQVTFTAVTSLSLNGVFSATYDNYVIVTRFTNTAAANHNQFRLRASGSDNSTANSYVHQRLESSSTTVAGSRTTSNLTFLSRESATDPSGIYTHVYGPFLAQPTALRTVDASARLGAYITEIASTHNQSTSYDGFTVFPDAGSITGAVQVYGVRS
jgi:hypothetical protein